MTTQYPNFQLSREEKMARNAEKKQKIGQWLISEGYSDNQILSDVCGLAGTGAYHILNSMEKRNLVKSQKIGVGDRVSVIYSLTQNGYTALCQDDQLGRAFDPGRYSPFTIAHGLTLQKVRLSIQNQGGKWLKSDRELKKEAAEKKLKTKVPDGLYQDSNGQIVAVEIERSYKSNQRYRDIILSHLKSANAGHYERIEYYCFDSVKAARLKKTFESLEYVIQDMQKIELEQRHFDKFSFIDWRSQ